MLSGRRLNILDPSPLDVEISDIAHGLARVARWNGQTVGAYPFSVAQHSLLVEELAARAWPDAPASARLAALLHDGPEYVVGDLISPFKSAVGHAYRTVEAGLEHAIHLRFQIPADTAASRQRWIKSADTVAAYLEATELAGFSTHEAAAIFGSPTVSVAGLEDFLVPWTTQTAADRFLARFEVLTQEHTRPAGN